MINKLVTIIKTYSGIAGVLVLWTGIPMAMHKTGLGLIDNRPLSYLGVDPISAILFNGSLLLSSFLFIIFAFYTTAKFNASKSFLGYFLVGQAGQIIAAISPYGENSDFRRLHTVAAFILAFSLPFLIRQFAISMKSGPDHKLYSNLFYFELILFVVGIGLFVFTKGLAPLGEALPAIGFHAWIIVVTIISIHNTKV